MTPAPNTLKGIICILAAMAVLPMIDVFAKFLGQQNVPVMQMVWARFFFGSLITLPFAWHSIGTTGLWPENPKQHAARASFLILGTAFFFAALNYLPIADTLAIYFVQPILITALSPLLLGEHVGVKRWLTVAIGFIGVLIIIRPGFQSLNPGMVLALCAGASSAGYILMTRHMTGTAPAVVNTFHSSMLGALALTAAAPFYWQAPTSNQWLLLIALGAIAIAGHYLITKAYDYAEASLLSPLGYSEMITAVFVGWYFFNDFPDLWTFVGVTILIATAIYIAITEHTRSVAPL